MTFSSMFASLDVLINDKACCHCPLLMQALIPTLKAMLSGASLVSKGSKRNRKDCCHCLAFSQALILAL